MENIEEKPKKVEDIIEINESNYTDTDEIYTDFYDCPNCKNIDENGKYNCFSYLFRGFKYCPNCGIKLKWNV